MKVAVVAAAVAAAAVTATVMRVSYIFKGCSCHEELESRFFKNRELY